MRGSLETIPLAAYFRSWNTAIWSVQLPRPVRFDVIPGPPGSGVCPFVSILNSGSTCSLRQGTDPVTVLSAETKQPTDGTANNQARPKEFIASSPPLNRPGPGLAQSPRPSQHPRVTRTLETTKFKLFVLELRNVSPERVSDSFRVTQPFSERNRLATRLSAYLVVQTH